MSTIRRPKRSRVKKSRRKRIHHIRTESIDEANEFLTKKKDSLNFARRYGSTKNRLTEEEWNNDRSRFIFTFEVGDIPSDDWSVTLSNDGRSVTGIRSVGILLECEISMNSGAINDDMKSFADQYGKRFKESLVKEITTTGRWVCPINNVNATIEVLDYILPSRNRVIISKFQLTAETGLIALQSVCAFHRFIIQSLEKWVSRNEGRIFRTPNISGGVLHNTFTMHVGLRL